MLENTLLYLTSTGAQVWAALMVFHILYVRDLQKTLDEEFGEQWQFAKALWPGLVAHLSSDGSSPIRDRLPEFGLDDVKIARAETSRDGFVFFIESVRRHQIARAVGERCNAHPNWTFTAEELQERLDPIAEKVSTIQGIRSDLTVGFTWAFLLGSTGVVLNLIALARGYLKAGNEAALSHSVQNIFWLNFTIFLLFAGTILNAGRARQRPK